MKKYNQTPHPELVSGSHEALLHSNEIPRTALAKQARDDGCNFENKFMQLALAEAHKAFDQGEVPVGCVIVHHENGQVISSTRNSMQSAKNPNAHAEILAINEACLKLGSKNLSQCDIYITLEPCTMCASAISNARLARVYYSAPDEKQGAIEHGVRFFTSISCLHRPEIYVGLYKEESIKLIKSFFGKIRKNRL